MTRDFIKSAIVITSVLLLLVTVVVLIFVFHSSSDFPAPDEVQERASKEAPFVGFRHHNNSELNSLLVSYAQYYPHLARLYSIGKSIRNNDLAVIEISDNPGAHEPGEPEVKLVGGIHGNEVVGRELLLYLVDFLLKNYQTSEAVRDLVDSVRLHIVPSINPDGYEDAVEGDCDGVRGRENANQVDLNRNFPDQFGLGEFQPEQPETTSVINWTRRHPFVLSAALHGGALVVNYPFDNNAKAANQYSPSPDDRIFRHIALLYSQNNPNMRNGKCTDRCKTAEEEEYFSDGITNGAAWYPIHGGMQDWNYVQTNCFEFTIELGCRKYPLSGQLVEYWDANLNSLIRFINAVHLGIRGFVHDQHGQPIEGAVVSVEGILKNVTTHAMGDYWRLLAPKTQYTVSVYKSGYQSQSQTINVEQLYQLNFTLYSSP